MMRAPQKKKSKHEKKNRRTKTKGKLSPCRLAAEKEEANWPIIIKIKQLEKKSFGVLSELPLELPSSRSSSKEFAL
jgi:hypothetical protein